MAAVALLLDGRVDYRWRCRSTQRIVRRGKGKDVDLADGRSREPGSFDFDGAEGYAERWSTLQEEHGHDSAAGLGVRPAPQNKPGAVTMQSRIVQSLIAFLVSATLFFCFSAFVLSRSGQIKRERILTEEAYRDLQQYVRENNLDERKVRTVFQAEHHAGWPTYVVSVFFCALAIAPYSVSRRLLRRFAGRRSRPDEAPALAPKRTPSAGAKWDTAIHVHKREPASYGPIYIIGAFLLIGLIGTTNSWQPEKFNVPAYLFILLWHGMFLYWLFAFIRKESLFSHSRVAADDDYVWVDRSYVKVALGEEVIPIREISEILVVEPERFMVVCFPNDPKYVDFADLSQAERIVEHVLKANGDVKVKGMNVPPGA
ncbi:MAG: hypothetical protein ACYTG0_00310 [Planctomycetota bacterium]|jgi:hypothetical protein